MTNRREIQAGNRLAKFLHPPTTMATLGALE